MGQYIYREILAWCLILLGAFFLTKSVLVKGQKWTMRELLGLKIDKLKVFRNHFIQRLEAAFGFLFVLVGIGIHLYVLLRKTLDAHDPRHAYADVAKFMGGTIGVMVLLAIVFHYVCKYVSKKSFVEILAYLVVRYDYRIEEDQDLLKQLGEILDVRHSDEDTVESYTQRVEDALGLEKVRARVEKKHKPKPPS
jgi:hypothetical protein